jgi:hypothetical protein
MLAALRARVTRRKRSFKTRGQSPSFYACIALNTRGQSPGMYACFAMDLLAECHEQQVVSQASYSALRVRFIVGDREFTKSFLYQIHHLPPLFLHNACSVPRRNDLC